MIVDFTVTVLVFMAIGAGACVAADLAVAGAYRLFGEDAVHRFLDRHVLRIPEPDPTPNLPTPVRQPYDRDPDAGTVYVPAEWFDGGAA